MRKQPQTLVIGGTQVASGKSLLTLALANVLTNWKMTVTIVSCNYQTVTWRTIQSITAMSGSQIFERLTSSTTFG
ncbi:hypothetical protein RYX41_11320 [Lactiplantibacillus plantarum]|nr:hypothetical protein [Lactiplantibacillus plantarum]MDV2576865.1 hypothetical protein [Lactiplantibacillus plantarum]